jgi:hypothetical protein
VGYSPANDCRRIPVVENGVGGLMRGGETAR